MKNLKIMAWRYPKIYSIIVILVLTGCTADRLIKTKSYDVELKQCWDTIKYANGNMQQLNESLDREINSYQQIIEEVLVSREKALELTEVIKRQSQQDEPVPPAVLEALNLQMKKGLAFEGKISGGIARNECWFMANKESLEEKGCTTVR